MRSDHAHFRSLNAAILKMQSEDYQTHERARQTYNTGQEGSKQDSKEKASKKVYGKDGKVVHASLANLRRSLNKKNKAVAESVESAELMETSKAKIKGLIAGRKRQADAAADQLANVNKAYLGVTGKPKLGTTHPKTAGTVGKAAQGDDRLIDAGNVFRKQEMIARRKQQNAEWRLKGNKGKDPRNESVETVDEYTELLESVLLALCEELALDPNALLEGRMVAKKTTKKKTPRPIIKGPNGERTGKPDENGRDGRGGWVGGYDGGRGG